MLENGCLLLAPQQKRRTAMLTTILQIILPTSNQQHLSVELMSRWAKVLLTLTDINKGEERVSMLENGCLLLALQLLQCRQQQRNEKEEMAPQMPSTIVLSSIQTDRKKTGKWILKGKQPTLTFPFLRVPWGYRVNQY